MQSIQQFMTGDHRHCDELFVAAERLSADGDWDSARLAFDAFYRAIEHHFTMEEEVLFPEFEEASGSTMGPTQVMRMEHGQMRDLFAAMGEAIERRDTEGFLGEAETLLILMQQHNAKEEQILYPMSERMLAPRGDEVLERMRAVNDGGD